MKLCPLPESISSETKGENNSTSRSKKISAILTPEQQRQLVLLVE